MENPITWLLIADASKARVYALHKVLFLQHPTANSLQLIQDFTHDESRKKKSELVSDKMGEFGSGTFVETTSPKLHEAEVFAQELLEFIRKNHEKGVFRDLILVSPPTFMGLLHKHIPTQVKKSVSQNIEKDYTQNNEQQLVQ